MRPWWAPVVLLCAAACTPGRQNTARLPTDPGSTRSEQARGAEEGGGEKPGPETLEKIPSVEDNPALSIRPTGRTGWKPENRPLAELGGSMDASISGLKEAYAETETIYVNRGNNASAKLDWKIRDADTYRIEWIEPKSMANINYIVRDGAKSGLRFDGGTPKAKSWPVAQRQQSIDLDKFAADPLRTIVGTFESGSGTWRRILAALEAGQDGFTVKKESADVGVRGSKRKITRIVAKAPSGSEIEIVVDDERKLPLTVKTSKKGADGMLDKTLWTAKWASGGRHEDSSFQVP